MRLSQQVRKRFPVILLLLLLITGFYILFKTYGLQKPMEYIPRRFNDFFADIDSSDDLTSEDTSFENSKGTGTYNETIPSNASLELEMQAVGIGFMQSEEIFYEYGDNVPADSDQSINYTYKVDDADFPLEPLEISSTEIQTTSSVDFISVGFTQTTPDNTTVLLITQPTVTLNNTQDPTLEEQNITSVPIVSKLNDKTQENSTNTDKSSSIQSTTLVLSSDNNTAPSPAIAPGPVNGIKKDQLEPPKPQKTQPKMILKPKTAIVKNHPTANLPNTSGELPNISTEEKVLVAPSSVPPVLTMKTNDATLKDLNTPANKQSQNDDLSEKDTTTKKSNSEQSPDALVITKNKPQQYQDRGKDLGFNDDDLTLSSMKKFPANSPSKVKEDDIFKTALMNDTTLPVVVAGKTNDDAALKDVSTPVNKQSQRDDLTDKGAQKGNSEQPADALVIAKTKPKQYLDLSGDLGYNDDDFTLPAMKKPTTNSPSKKVKAEDDILKTAFMDDLM